MRKHVRPVEHDQDRLRRSAERRGSISAPVALVTSRRGRRCSRRTRGSCRRRRVQGHEGLVDVVHDHRVRAASWPWYAFVVKGHAPRSSTKIAAPVRVSWERGTTARRGFGERGEGGRARQIYARRRRRRRKKERTSSDRTTARGRRRERDEGARRARTPNGSHASLSEGGYASVPLRGGRGGRGWVRAGRRSIGARDRLAAWARGKRDRRSGSSEAGARRGASAAPARGKEARRRGRTHTRVAP